MSMDPLATALLDLSAELPHLPSPLLVGGGFGLYLKQLQLEAQRATNTLLPGELWPPARATEDVDLLLPTEVIVSVEHMSAIRSALDRLGYEPEVEFIHFVKQTSHGPVRIELLTCDVSDDDAGKVKIKPPRVRPIGDVQLHAYLAKEAIALSLSPISITLRGRLSDGRSAQAEIQVPNSFTYLLMKLHAFRDRKNDPRKKLASHHAIDLYRLVAMMTREEYDLAVRLREQFRDSPSTKQAADIVSRYFCGESDIGLLRLKAGANDTGLTMNDIRSAEFIGVLKEIFLQADA